MISTPVRYILNRLYLLLNLLCRGPLLQRSCLFSNFSYDGKWLWTLVNVYNKGIFGIIAYINLSTKQECDILQVLGGNHLTMHGLLGSWNLGVVKFEGILQN